VTFNPRSFRRVQRVDDVVGERLRNLDEREAVVDLDGADRARFDADFPSYRADEIAGPNARPPPPRRRTRPTLSSPAGRRS
jgi:hypothetical protein